MLLLIENVSCNLKMNREKHSDNLEKKCDSISDLHQHLLRSTMVYDIISWDPRLLCNTFSFLTP